MTFVLVELHIFKENNTWTQNGIRSRGMDYTFMFKENIIIQYPKQVL